MPHPPKVKVSKEEMREMGFGRIQWPFPMDDLPPQVAEEVKQKIEQGEKYVQFRMPLDVWAKTRARQYNMNKDAKEILQKNHLPLPSARFGTDLVPMSEVLRKMFENPLNVKEYEIIGMVHKKGKGRVFR